MKQFIILEPGDRFRVLVPGCTPDVSVGSMYLVLESPLGLYFIDDAGDRNYAICARNGVGSAVGNNLLEFPGQIEFIEGVENNG